MFDFLIKMLLDLSLLVGYVKNQAYPPPLSKEEEDQYVLELLNHQSTQARSKIIEHNLRLVAHIAKKYEGKFSDTEELISIGTIGLIKAVDSYSNDKGVRIATYASRCIENEMLMHLRTNKKVNKDVSLFESIGQDKDGSDITLIDVIPSNEMPLDEQLEKKDNLTSLLKFLKVLNERELEILTLRYGLNNSEEFTQREVARHYNISRSYVSRIEKRALTKLLQEFKKSNIL